MSNTQEKRAALEAKADQVKANIAEEISDIKQIAKERGMQKRIFRQRRTFFYRLRHQILCRSPSLRLSER